MSKPKHQHFIPKSYLRNFGERLLGEKVFVECKQQSREGSTCKKESISNLCVKKNIYTIPNGSEDEKYIIEKFYATNVDSIYPDIYNLLINPEIEIITKQQREKIISTTLSLFFRTPKFLNLETKQIDNLVDLGMLNSIDEDGIVRILHNGIEVTFHKLDAEKIKAKLKINAKIDFLGSHLEDWQNFIHFKANSAICVYKICDDIELITSDNPVCIHSVEGKEFDVFDPTNIISLPLDRRHFLTIMPNSVGTAGNRIYRSNRDKWFALLMNLEVQENCEEWIIGFPNSIQKHLTDQIKYGEYSSDNLKQFLSMRERALDLQMLTFAIEETGTPFHPKVKKLMDTLKEKEIHKSDSEFINFCKQLGY